MEREIGVCDSEFYFEFGYVLCVNGWVEVILGDCNNIFWCLNVSLFYMYVLKVCWSFFDILFFRWIFIILLVMV